MNIKFLSCFLDHSEYARAARSSLLAMTKAGVNVSTQILSYQVKTSDFGEGKKLAKKLENKKIKYDTKLIMLTPDKAALQMEKGKCNICAMLWEVLGLNEEWVENMNRFDKIWVASQTLADTFKQNGVHKPIKVVKLPIKVTDKRKHKRLKILGFNGFLFYSILQWAGRKNPKALLEAYWKAFENKKDVGLLLKVYRASFSEDEKELIRKNIKEWKQEFNLSHYPKVFLVFGELSNEESMRLHSTGDCFVSTYKGEGLGLSQIEAMSIGNPIISANFGGIHKLFNDENSWLVDYKQTQAFNMIHKQLWADVDVEQLRKSMLKAYLNRKLTAQKGKLAKTFIRDNLSMGKHWQ